MSYKPLSAKKRADNRKRAVTKKNKQRVKKKSLKSHQTGGLTTCEMLYETKFKLYKRNPIFSVIDRKIIDKVIQINLIIEQWKLVKEYIRPLTRDYMVKYRFNDDEKRVESFHDSEWHGLFLPEIRSLSNKRSSFKSKPDSEHNRYLCREREAELKRKTNEELKIRNYELMKTNEVLIFLEVELTDAERRKRDETKQLQIDASAYAERDREETKQRQINSLVHILNEGMHDGENYELTLEDIINRRSENSKQTLGGVYDLGPRAVDSTINPENTKELKKFLSEYGRMTVGDIKNLYKPL